MNNLQGNLEVFLWGEVRGGGASKFSIHFSVSKTSVLKQKNTQSDGRIWKGVMSVELLVQSCWLLFTLYLAERQFERSYEC